MDLWFKRNNKDDKQEIRNLMRVCFGYTAITNPVIYDGKYLLAYDNDKLVAMTGVLVDETDYDGAEVDYTCCLPEYRGLGITEQLLKLELSTIDETLDVYCEAWTVKDKVHLSECLENSGFKPIHTAGVRWYDCFKSCKACVYRDNTQACKCGYTLYKKEGVLKQ